MKRRPIVAGNWKMNGTLAQARSLTQQILQALADQEEVETVLCPPFTALSEVQTLIRGSTLQLGAQNLFWQPQGAFTGEVSAPLLKELGCRYCILGHSERRQLFGETDADIRKKVGAALSHGLNAILCVGETQSQRQAGKTWAVVERQLREGLAEIPAGLDWAGRLVIAYEPVWAIGTGQNATPEQAQQVHAQIRRWLTARAGEPAARALRIQYGGSVNAQNASSLMRQADVDGGLIGGASIKGETFIAIVEATRAAKESKCSTV